ncbi:trehalose-phosphatase [Nesterenkonia alba]|uniref:trehalose-phosphatase n=1 Tax=Nesterenkonia alba TaxID=515814 RepID=UPI0003B50A26|nr:trehalose-phosphatase [Nesterenkonia alba]
MSDAALPEDLAAAMRTLAHQPQVLICLDFDGCVAELVPDAHLARPVPANAAAIERLAGLDDGVHLAYVSGRPLEGLRELASPPEGTLLVGSHGAEKDLGDGSPSLVLTSAQQRAREDIIRILEQIAATYEGAWVEHKPAGAAIHVRHIEDLALGESILDEARSALTIIDGAHQKEGKQILEAVVVLATKGEAIDELRAELAPDAVFFAGDDVTDEHGFAVLGQGDVGVKVGPGETRAAYRIPAPESLAEVLEVFAEARTAG